MSRANTTTIRRIRVVGQARAPLAVRLGLGIPLGLLIICFVAWRFTGSSEQQLEPFQREFEDVSILWTCPAGHAFRGRARVEPRPCPTCGAPGVPADRYFCSEHGVTVVEIRFDVASEDPARPLAVQYRFPRQAWLDLADGVSCPRCGKPMERLADDPLSQRKSP